ncbi:MAG: hypothetical protein JXB34_14660 [Bacteroidales bacterium]|nr:hypothetical protein [Bacteroidales bacterium]
MSNKLKIYIVFPESETNNPWISRFADNLAFSARNILQWQFQVVVKGSGFVSVNTQWQLSQTDIFVAIMPALPITDKAFQAELNAICSLLGSGETGETNYNRIYKVLLAPNESIAQPASLKPLRGYNFFEYQGIKRTLSVFGFEGDSRKSWAKILDLLYDLNDYLISASTEKIKNFVYLSGSSDEHDFYREDIKREFQHHGYRALPLTELPRDKDILVETVTENLKQCDTIVQIFGGQFGLLTSDGRNSVSEAENIAIRQFLDKNPEKRQYIWIPAGLKLRDPKQELFLNRVRRDESTYQSQIIEATPEEFKDILSATLFTARKQSTAYLQRQAYLVAPAGADISFLEMLAGSFNVSLTKNIESGKVVPYQSHLGLLQNIDNILVFTGNAEFEWIRSKIGDAVKAIGMGRKRPFNQFLVVGTLEKSVLHAMPWPDIAEFAGVNDNTRLKAFFSTITEQKAQ